ncbi:uncharacterized protein LOC108311916 isoform X2 [Cebus imitator]|uniref:uncharacterized protein LOC108311916 isoform X2 n=1 Tax=Cebus imitator TaxID=2715852 RepID=UPI000809BE77|nr:uncharacterized protein LOC108311916 isoform X2 [Cebus imitator]
MAPSEFCFPGLENYNIWEREFYSFLRKNREPGTTPYCSQCSSSCLRLRLRYSIQTCLTSLKTTRYTLPEYTSVLLRI